MNELRVFLHDDLDVVDSREVAGLVGRRHDHLIRNISNYIEIMKSSNAPKIGDVDESDGLSFGLSTKTAEHSFTPSDFFIPSTYKDSKGETRPCYLLTKKGCDMVANKMTGEKGVLFTAAYVTAFEKMREHIQRGTTHIQPQIDSEVERTKLSIKKAELLNQIAADYTGTYRQILQAYATRELTGDFALPLPRVERHTYTAGQIGEKLGISANKVGILANKHGLKTDEYGAWFVDKSRHSNKEVESFRYYEDVIPVLRNLLPV